GRRSPRRHHRGGHAGAGGAGGRLVHRQVSPRSTPARERAGPPRPDRMNFHHLLEAVGILAIGLLFYSSAYPRLLGPARRERGARALLHGVAFGALTVAMMASRIEISPGIFVDARVVPVALIGFFEGTPAALIAAAVGSVYRVWIGGSGTGAGIFSLVPVAPARRLIPATARPE